MGRDSFDLNAPVSGTFAGGLVGEALSWLENIDGGTFGGELLGDGARDWAAYLFIGIEKQNDLALKEAGLGEHFDGSEGHGNAGFHVENAGAAKPAIGDAPGHGAEGADRPDCVEMAEHKNW